MVVWSSLAHVGALGLVLSSPGDHAPAAPQVISVELSAPPTSAPQPSAPSRPAAAPPPPKPKAKQVVLPEKPREPQPEKKAKPREREIFVEPEKKEEKSLDDLLAEMRGDAPESPSAAEEVETSVAPVPSPGAAGGSGSPLSAEERDWHARVIRRMKGIWVVPPGFRTQSLETRVVVRLDATGNVLGTPEITQRSGNPWYDEGVVRGITKASPLPPPPEAGEWVMWFRPSDSL